MGQLPNVIAEDCRVPLRDGVQLACDVVRPDDDARHPVLLVRTPYSRAGVREYFDPIKWARDGWVVVAQDVRGRYDSDGVFAPFHQEVADGADTVAWCAAQPWSTGRVAMAGPSYNGATQWLAAMGQPDALGAIAPAATAANFRDGFFYEGGVPHNAFPVSWATMLAASRPGIGKAEMKRLVRLAHDWPAVLRGGAVRQPVSAALPDLDRWAAYDDDTYWRPIDVSRAYRRLDLPAWHLAGWYDIFCEGTLESYVGMSAHAATDYARRNQRLVVGPWTHMALYVAATAEVDFGLAANGLAEGLPDQMRAFLAAALDRQETLSGVRVFVMGRNSWLDLETWPPPSTPTVLHLSSSHGANGIGGDGHLGWEPPERSGHDSYRHDPADPVPNRGGRTLSPVLPLAGPMDQRPVESRDDVLVYTTDPLPRALTVIGTITASIVFASSADHADVMVKVCDVHPDGRTLNVVDGATRVELTPGRARSVGVRVGSTAMTFKKGHRIRVEIASSNFPHLGLLPDAATQTVRHGGRRPSTVTLPEFKG